MSLGYQYVTLRFVPAPEREEFLNVGVVLYSQMADYLDIAYDVNPVRLQAFSASSDADEVTAALETLRRSCTTPPAAGMTKLGQRFGWLSAPRSTVIQPGPMHGGLTDDPERELRRLLATLVR